MRSFIIFISILSVLTISENILAQEPTAGPCAKVTCSNHGNCVLKGGDPVCACFEGYAPDLTTGLSCLPYQSSVAGPGAAQEPPVGQSPLQQSKQKEHDRWLKPRHSFGVTGGLSVVDWGELLVFGGFSVFGDFSTGHRIYVGVEYQFFVIDRNSLDNQHWVKDVRMYAMWFAFSVKFIWIWQRFYVYPGFQLLAGFLYAKGKESYGSEETKISEIAGGDILAGCGLRVHPYVSFFMETKYILAWGYSLVGGIFNFGLRGLF